MTLDVVVFFFRNLSRWQLILFFCFIILHVHSHVEHLNAEKKLVKSIPKIVNNPSQSDFNLQLLAILSTNVGYLLLYAGTMFVIEMLGKLAVRNAFDTTTARLLKVDTTHYDKATYEHEMASLVHHRENLMSIVKNLFVEFPRKSVACFHFLFALYELSFDVMVYCLVSNIIFLIGSIAITYVRKRLNVILLENNIRSNLICLGAGRSIASHKVDDRIEEFTNLVSERNNDTWYRSSLDSFMVASNEAASGFSSQFMIALISHLCRPMLLSQTIDIEDLMYGVRSSSKFVEKLAGMLGYFEDVIRQYKSFHFFTGHTDKIAVEKEEPEHAITALRLFDGVENHYFSLGGGAKSHLIRLGGMNGVGKTTALNGFLGPRFRDALSSGKLEALGEDTRQSTKGTAAPALETSLRLNPTAYRKRIGFAQQNVPATEDTVASYILSVCKLNKPSGGGEGSVDAYSEILATFTTWFPVRAVCLSELSEFLRSIPETRRIADLSGGQAKMIQILTAITKIREEPTKLLVLDEPTNNLDVEKVQQLKEIFKALRNQGVSIIMVTHTDALANETGFQTWKLYPPPLPPLPPLPATTSSITKVD